MPTHSLIHSITDLLTASWSPAPAAAHLSAQSGQVGAYTLTGGRVLGAGALLVALAGAVIGVWVLVRSTRGRGTAGVALAWVAGVLGIVGGAGVVLAADGGPGTGNGVVGGFLAVVLGFLGVVLGSVALILGRRRADVPTDVPTS
jgi:hypothetical protein